MSVVWYSFKWNEKTTSLGDAEADNNIVVFFYISSEVWLLIRILGDSLDSVIYALNQSSI